MLLLVIGGFLFYKKKSTKSTVGTGDRTNVNNINFDPPTDEEKQQAEDHKAELEKKLGSENTNSAPNTDPASVTLTYIRYTGQGVEGAGFVNVFEEGGTCTLTLTKGSSKVTAVSQGFTDVNKTTCPPVTIARSQIPQAGEWTVILSYKSETKNGSSAEQKVSVP